MLQGFTKVYLLLLSLFGFFWLARALYKSPKQSTRSRNFWFAVALRSFFYAMLGSIGFALLITGYMRALTILIVTAVLVLLSEYAVALVVTLSGRRIDSG